MKPPPFHRPRRPRPGPARLAWALAAWAWVAGVPAMAAVPLPSLRAHDVVAFVGGAAVVAADQAGMVETVLTLAHRDRRLRFRNLAWEGDTVFDRPRDPNFPALTNLLARADATVVAFQFGSLESFEGDGALPTFRAAYEGQLSAVTAALPSARVILVTPPPFESKPPPLPDLGARNPVLARFAQAVRDLAEARGYPVIDLHGALAGAEARGEAWTLDGRELNEAGHRAVAAAWARAFGRPDLAELALQPGFWARPDIAQVRGAVAAKNQHWFHYWRPMNWAFLHGDRTEQLSSRDHRDPSIRWFPAEMERFVPLIAEGETRIESLAAQVVPPP